MLPGMAISIRLDKSFTYRGNAEQWSNKYHLTGSNPADAAEWKAITDALVAAEKLIYDSTVTVVHAAGYTSDTGPNVYYRDYNTSPDTPVAGTYVGTGGNRTSGDVAWWVRWWCGQYNSRGKKIWLRKYFHDAYAQTGGTGDSLLGTQKTAGGTFATTLQSGLTITGYSSRSLCDKNGHTATSHDVVTYLTTRTLKRRSNSPL